MLWWRMAKPKGGTLAALWEVSEKERREFFERISTRDLNTETQSKEESTGPLPGIPVSGVPFKGIPVLSQSPQNRHALARPEESHRESGVPDLGRPVSRAPLSGTSLGPPSTESKITIVTDTHDVPPAAFSGIPVLDTLTSVQPSQRPHKIRRAERVQDGHSLGEHLVLTTLWKAAVAVPGMTLVMECPHARPFVHAAQCGGAVRRKVVP